MTRIITALLLCFVFSISLPAQEVNATGQPSVKEMGKARKQWKVFPIRRRLFRNTYKRRDCLTWVKQSLHIILK